MTVHLYSNFKIKKKSEHCFNACGNLFVIILPSIISSNFSASSPQCSHHQQTSPCPCTALCRLPRPNALCRLPKTRSGYWLQTRQAETHTRTNTHFLPMTVSLIPRIVPARSYPTLMLTFYDSAEERKGAYGQICCWWSASVILRGLTCTRFCIWASAALCVMCWGMHIVGCIVYTTSCILHPQALEAKKGSCLVNHDRQFWWPALFSNLAGVVLVKCGGG